MKHHANSEPATEVSPGSALKKSSLRIFFTGFGMGTADLVPGVSGGTIAFIFGIYETLINTIKHLTGPVLQLILRGKLIQAFREIPFGFIIPLATGLFAAIFTLSKLIAWLLTEHPVFLWSFFFGLVLASIVIVAKRVGHWSAANILACIVSATGTYFLVGAVPVETPNTLPWIFGSGAMAIIAMILPGISGSFILLILGKYSQILAAVNNRDFITLLVFIAGCAVGIGVFSRALSFLFKHYHDVTIAILTGFLVGSLRKVWPWKEAIITRVNSHGEVVPVVERNLLPAIEPATFAALALILAGVGLMAYFQRFESSKDKPKTEKIVNA
ncbi:MAG: DUF368 domain-containing protein [Patescibacteria group bacterium]|nr:DUF368 domain-containing protein [Patescibacteria group bacterium]